MKCTYCGITYRKSQHPLPVCAAYSVKHIRRQMAPGTKWHSESKLVYNRRKERHVER